MFAVKPVSVHYCYKEYQPQIFGEMQREDGVNFFQGVPDVDTIKSWSQKAGGKHILLILDDLQMEICSNPQTASLFSVIAHHCSVSILFLVQNPFPRGKAARDISLNCHYITLFSTKRDKMAISNLARQITPGQNGYFMSAYEDAVCARTYKYLTVDLHPLSPREYMLRTNLMPDESPVWVYLPK